jgi:hypothetical protein
MAIKISGSTIIDDSRNIVNVGVITATSFSGDGFALTGVGIGSTGDINTSGIITATKVSASEFEGSGDKLIFSPSPTEFIPTDGSTGVSLNPTISITFDQKINLGVGTITLRNSSGIGTIIESFDVGVSTYVSVSTQTLSITPSASLPINTDVYVVIPSGAIKNNIGGNNKILDTYNFTTLDFALSSITPANGATNVGISTNITLTFTSAPVRGTGTVTLRSDSTSGTVLESFNAASSDRISIAGNNWVLDPTSNLPYNKSIHTIIPSTAITNYVGLNTTGADTHSFTTVALNLGDSYEGGFLICCSSPTRWVVAPNTSEVTRTWANRNDANTRAQQVSGCAGWFVPTSTQMQNPGYTCRTYWDSFSNFYWSSTEFNVSHAIGVRGDNGNIQCNSKVGTTYVRSFRCVTY